MTRNSISLVIILFLSFSVRAGAVPLPPPITCNVTASPAQVRSEGVSERMGDIAITCTGGTPTAPGQPVALNNIRIALGVPITSRIVDPNTNASEVLLFIDEPFPTSPFPSSAQQVPGSPTGQNLCFASGGTKCQILGVAAD